MMIEIECESKWRNERGKCKCWLFI